MKEHVPADAKLAAVEVGTLGWYSELHIIDILGVVTPGNSRLLGDRRFGEWLVHHPPDYIIAHDPIWDQEIGIEDALARGEFVEQEGVAIEGYRLYRPKP